MSKTIRRRSYRNWCPKSCEYCRSNRMIATLRLESKIKEELKECAFGRAVR